jgi:hypothetical protein
LRRFSDISASVLDSNLKKKIRCIFGGPLASGNGDHKPLEKAISN